LGLPLSPGLALILDMDGVVIHSNPIHRRAWEVFNRRYGLETTVEMHERMFGRRNDDIIRDFFGDGLTPAEITSRGAAKEEVYREMVGGRVEEALVPGIREFLERHAGSLLGLATNAEPANVNFLLDASGLRRYFRVIVDGHQVKHPKPDPEIYLLISRLLRTSPANCIVFEDSFSGVKAARSAGMRVVGVRTTHGQLPGTALEIDNFSNGDLDEWLGKQEARV
jgi:beta-phosphoglucomutase family hydrolase